MISDLSCLSCGNAAFAVINLEITPGRARYPLCTRTTCIERTIQEAGRALHRAAGQHFQSPVIDTTADTKAEDP